MTDELPAEAYRGYSLVTVGPQVSVRWQGDHICWAPSVEAAQGYVDGWLNAR